MNGNCKYSGMIYYIESFFTAFNKLDKNSIFTNPFSDQNLFNMQNNNKQRYSEYIN